MRFLNSVTVAKNVNWGFLTSFVTQNIEINEREDPLVQSKKVQKSRIMPTKIRVKNSKGGSYVFEVLDVDVFVLDEILLFRVCFGRP